MKQQINSTYISFEQAKWLDNKIKSKKVYDNGILKNKPSFSLGHISDYRGRYVYAPEQWQVVEWLRVNYNIWISVDYSEDDNYFIYGIRTKSKDYFDDGFNSPQKAYSAAFDYIKDNDLIGKLN